MYFLHLRIKSPIFPMYIQAVELCNKFSLHYDIYYNISKDPLYRRKSYMQWWSAPQSQNVLIHYMDDKIWWRLFVYKLTSEIKLSGNHNKQTRCWYAFCQNDNTTGCNDICAQTIYINNDNIRFQSPLHRRGVTYTGCVCGNDFLDLATYWKWGCWIRVRRCVRVCVSGCYVSKCMVFKVLLSKRLPFPFTGFGPINTFSSTIK